MRDSEERAESVEEWLQAARSGDSAARERLCAFLRPRLLEYVSRRSGPAVRRWTDPEDIAQKVLFELISGLDKFPPNADEDELFRRLFRTAESRIKDDARRNHAQAGESLAPGSEIAPRGGEASSGPVTRADDSRWLRELIRHLPDKYRDVVRLCALERRTFDEAAQELDLDVWAVRKRYERARNALIERSRKEVRDDG